MQQGLIRDEMDTLWRGREGSILETMKHYYVVAPGEIGVVEEPVPVPGPADVLVRMTHTAISPGSNVYIYRTGSYLGRWLGENQDCVYMGSGEVTACGGDVSGLAVGDRVAMTGVGHQEFAVVPEGRAHKLPDGVSLETASLSYLAGWAVSALHLGRYAAAETVAVVGLGLVGASTALVADMMGARVVALDVAPERLAFGASLGLGSVVEAGSAGTLDQVGEFAGARGVDLVMETSGAWTGFDQAFALCREYSRIALMGLYRTPPSAELALKMHEALYAFPSKLHYKKIEIVGCGYDPESAQQGSPFTFTRDGNYAYLLEQAGRGKVALDTLVTHRFAPDEVGSVLERFAQGDRSMIGAVFAWE